MWAVRRGRQVAVPPVDDVQPPPGGTPGAVLGDHGGRTVPADGPPRQLVQLPPGGTLLGDHAWEPWHPSQLVQILSSVTAPWYVAGGWALDLFRGQQTREHEDLEIAVPNTAEAFGQVRQALEGYQIQVPGGQPTQLWPLDSLAFKMMHQTWVSEEALRADRALQVFRLDIFREPQRDGRWACRRDENIVLPYDEVICHDHAGIPYLAPHLVLLFKAKAARDKDQADLAGVLPMLDPSPRSWLAATIERLYPGHQWLEQL